MNSVHTDWRNCLEEKRVENLGSGRKVLLQTNLIHSQQMPDGVQNVPHKEGLISCLVGHVYRHQHLILDQGRGNCLNQRLLKLSRTF